MFAEIIVKGDVVLNYIALYVLRGVSNLLSFLFTYTRGSEY